MDIKITPQLLASSPAHQQMALFALMNGGSARWQGDGTVYGLDAAGEMLVQPEHLPLFMDNGISVDNGEFYIEMPAEEYASAVDGTFPESLIDGSARTWGEYSPFSTPSVDGTFFLVRCVKVAPGNTSGMGLSAEEFRAWYVFFEDRLLTKAQGRALLMSDKYSTIGMI